MNTNADKLTENKSLPVASSLPKQQSNDKSAFQFVDNRPEAIAQRKLQETINNRPRVQQLKTYQAMTDQRSSPQNNSIQKKENNTGLPDDLKLGIETLSNHSMDDVRVHYNSDKPAQLQAHAYAQGTDIHLAPGQQKHLAHEAWHVVQQKQGRVQPTLQMKGSININDDAGLEKEADMMGDQALQRIQTKTQITGSDPIDFKKQSSVNAPVQRIRIKLDHANDPIMNNVRAAKVPKPGKLEVEGFINYNNKHDPIENDENIILEGHGTHLKSTLKKNDPYDSQAELTPQQLANIAFMIPKHDGWNGQIILFGCATGSLTLEVSKHYLALSDKSVNVVGTLADIKMEVPGGLNKVSDGKKKRVSDAKKKELFKDLKTEEYEDQHEHRAEYEIDGEKYPRAPKESVSARTQFLRWLNSIETAVTEVITKLLQFHEGTIAERESEGRDNLAKELYKTIQCFRLALFTRSNYQGITYNMNENSEKDIQKLVERLSFADKELTGFQTSLADPVVTLKLLETKATEFVDYFSQLMEDLSVLDNLAMRSEEAVSEGVVDWEGNNVMNSRADDAHGVSDIPLNKKDLISDKWGRRGGGQMLTNMHTYEDDLT